MDFLPLPIDILIRTEAVIFAFLAATGVVLVWFAFLMPGSVIVQEMSPVEKVRRSSWLERLDQKIEALGADGGLRELIFRGLFIGVVIALPMAFSGYLVAALLSPLVGIYIYYEYLLYSTEKQTITFKESFADVIDDIADLYPAHNGNLMGVIDAIVEEMKQTGLLGQRDLVRPAFYQVRQMCTSGAGLSVDDALDRVGASRPGDPFWIYLFEMLAMSYRQGGDIIPFLRDLENAIREEIMLLRQHISSLTEARITGIAYAFFPPLILLVVRWMFGGEGNIGLRFDPGGPVGILSQIIAVGSAVLTWYLMRKLGSAGLNVYEEYEKIHYEYTKEDILI